MIEVFSCNDEKWAKLIKSEKQLRKKTYDAKVSELFPVPGKAVEEQPKKTDNDDSVSRGADVGGLSPEPAILATT